MDRAIQMGLRANRLYPLLARARDIIFSLLALLLLAPVFPLIGLGARRSTRGSALFHQVRVGRDGKHFVVEKFRTLSFEAPSDVSKRDAEHLATPLGRFMRRFKLDELPQFWNVLKGDMSLVGPRPIIPAEYSGDEPPLRLAVRPGLTGLWQLSRVREQSFDENKEYDLFYLANRSIAFDLWLIWRTVLLIATGNETKIRLAAQLWERNPAWRQLVPARSRSIPARRGWLRSRTYLLAVTAAVLLACAPGIAVALSGKGDLLEAQNSLIDARRAATRLDAGTARAELETARRMFENADGKLSSWLTAGLRVIPGLNNNLEVPQSFARAGASMVEAGNSGLEILDRLPLQGGRVAASLEGGTLDLAPFAAAEGPARRLQAELDQAQKSLAETPSDFLLPSVANARSKGISTLADAKAEADIAAGAAFLIPRLFGSDGPRNWIIGAENNAELRGRGGYVGSLGTLSAANGELKLAQFQPTSGLPSLPQDPTLGGTVDSEYFEQYLDLGGTVAWQNLLMSPDFPTGADLMLANLQKVANMPADGLIALDPVALSYLLRATGPVDVPGIPEKLTSDNIVEWSLNKIYFFAEGEQDERKELLSVIASTVWGRLLTDPNLNAREVARALGQAFSERHLVIYSAHEDEQKVIEQLGIGGTVEQTGDDYLLLVGQNVAENKMDYYLSRDINYAGVLLDDGSMQVEVKTTVTHTAPAGTAFPEVVAGNRPDLPAGSARNYVSLFVPANAQLQEVLKGGTATRDFDNSVEQDKRRLSTDVEVAPGESQSVTYRYRIPDALFEGGYFLTVQNQATVRPDTLSIHIKPPEGAIITDRWGFDSGEELAWQGLLRSDLEFGAELESPVWARIMNRVTSTLRQPVTGTTG